MSSNQEIIRQKGIKIGSIVVRTNTHHGRMEVGDEATVIDIIGTKICLDKDYDLDFTHDVKNIELSDKN